MPTSSQPLCFRTNCILTLHGGQRQTKLAVLRSLNAKLPFHWMGQLLLIPPRHTRDELWRVHYDWHREGAEPLTIYTMEGGRIPFLELPLQIDVGASISKRLLRHLKQQATGVQEWVHSM